MIASAAARAYGADVTVTAGSIGLDEPFPFRFQGTTRGLDLRRVPESVPVPRVESALTLDYDVMGQFSQPFIRGNALFARSQFLGALVEAGTVGSIDTSATPLRYTGDGVVRDLELHRLGAGLDVAWLQDPRYAGRVAGHFHVEGAGGDRESLVLTGGGRLERADLFHGRLSAADVTLAISGGTLTAGYNGRDRWRRSRPWHSQDERFGAALSGAVNVRTTVRDLLTRTPEAGDYDIDGAVDLTASTVRGIGLTAAHVDGQVRDAAAAPSEPHRERAGHRGTRRRDDRVRRRSGVGFSVRHHERRPREADRDHRPRRRWSALDEGPADGPVDGAAARRRRERGAGERERRHRVDDERAVRRDDPVRRRVTRVGEGERASGIPDARRVVRAAGGGNA